MPEPVHEVPGVSGDENEGKRFFPEIDFNQLGSDEARLKVAGDLSVAAGRELRKILRPVDAAGEPLAVSAVDTHVQLTGLYEEIAAIHLSELYGMRDEGLTARPASEHAFGLVNGERTQLELRMSQSDLTDATNRFHELRASRESARGGPDASLVRRPPQPPGTAASGPMSK